ncbi:MAG TPA: hypothetical protein VMV04_05545 [Thermodesulfobacteriota bacterium]|nr:hypothetical protein [Thermodesulfobacteriota bacterium]
MRLREITPRPSILIFPLLLLLVFGCSLSSWFSSHPAKTKELLDKEVVIIDQEPYVKVLNPKVSDGKDEPKYLYVPAQEYLSHKEAYTAMTEPIEEVRKGKEPSATPSKPASSLLEEETLAASMSKPTPSRLKKKVLITYFDDRTTQGEEVFGDWVAEKLMKEVNRRTLQVLFVDYQMVKEFYEKKGVNLKDLEKSKGLLSLNEVFGAHALVAGELSGPYVFTTQTTKEQEATASAIIKIDMRLMDTFTGKTVKTLSANNPIVAAKEKGSFSEEKAKIKAIDVTLANLGRSLAKELDDMDWFCRIAKVEGEDIYLNAGRLTGLQVGDVMDVSRPGRSGEQAEVKGKIRILAFFGIDGSMGRLVQGKNPDVNDVLKLAKREGP